MNTELRCEAKKCVYNLERFCTAPRIKVKGEDTMGGRFTYCSTFNLDGDGEASWRHADKNINYNYFINSPEIICTAQNCEYNQREMCHASYVKIVSGIATAPIQTECQTFIPREGLYSSDIQLEGDAGQDIEART
jgi:hypothetical protein